MSPELHRLRHSLAHVLAQAVKRLYPNVQLGFGPATDDGFYYDFDFGEVSIANKDLKKLEREMKKIIHQDQPFTKVDCNYQQAMARLTDETYKRQQVESLHDQGIEVFSFYENSQRFSDLCRGPHVERSGQLPNDAFKLDRISGAYWRGDERQPMLTRIYGLAFMTAEQLKKFLELRVYAEQFDHKRLGKELEIFTFNDLVGKGLALWLPNGTVIRDEIERYAREVEQRYGYQRVITPQIAKADLYHKSHHLPAYQESMFPPLTTDDDNNEVFYLRPMNCPHHHLIFAHRQRSYRELPLRLAEFGTCYRHEQSGELSGLLRVRCLTINDAHIYLRMSQLADELQSLIAMHREFYQRFCLEKFRVRLSIGDHERQSAKYLGEQKMWYQAERILRETCETCKLEYFVGTDEAAFYGPKIDFQFRNLNGREETLSTIQLDFLSPSYFELKYTDEQDNEQAPVIIHRAPLSSHERFISMLLEHYGGAMPSWCAPLQVMVVPIASSCHDYGRSIVQQLGQRLVRVQIDLSTNSLNKKIRNCALKKIPFQLIIGDKEVAQQQVTMRRHGNRDQTTLATDQALALIVDEIEQRNDPRRPLLAEAMS